ncbi:hypothetical protein GBAR_LOCUS20981 [Geodia barretti]|uniref:C3H1-type domain-containing protein n=1 Tax=Geodia barretti TaxID=519541 RepID=A0AA35SXY2_GEOBA|nr:hypothetical protein GBAR_LOCUS20981 [Geodia barretti]
MDDRVREHRADREMQKAIELTLEAAIAILKKRRPKRKKVCRFYWRGQICRYGDECRFVHERPRERQRERSRERSREPTPHRDPSHQEEDPDNVLAMSPEQ